VGELAQETVNPTRRHQGAQRIAELGSPYRTNQTARALPSLVGWWLGGRGRERSQTQSAADRAGGRHRIDVGPIDQNHLGEPPEQARPTPERTSDVVEIATLRAANRKTAVPALPATLRIAVAPIRVAWARRYAALIGPAARDIVAFEESHRYSAYERRTVAFEAAYVSFAKAMMAKDADSPSLRDLATRAVRASAALAIYRGEGASRPALADSLIDQYATRSKTPLEPNVLRDVANGHQRLRLHLL
jgi:hypothetical protein